MAVALSQYVLPLGLYNLTKTLVNPRGNMRCKQNVWKRHEWFFGWKFIVVDDIDVSLAPPYGYFPTLKKQGSFWGMPMTTRNDDILSVIVPHLFCVGGLENMLSKASEDHSPVYPEHVLEQLLKEKRLTLDEIGQFIQRFRQQRKENS